MTKEGGKSTSVSVYQQGNDPRGTAIWKIGVLKIMGEKLGVRGNARLECNNKHPSIVII